MDGHINIMFMLCLWTRIIINFNVNDYEGKNKPHGKKK